MGSTFRTILNFRKPSDRLALYRYANLDHADEHQVEQMLTTTGITHRIDLRSPFEIMESKHSAPPPVKPTLMAKRFQAVNMGQRGNSSLATAVTSHMRPLHVFKVNRRREKEAEKIVFHQTQIRRGKKIELYNVNFITMRYMDKVVWDTCTKADKTKMLTYMLTFRFTKLLRFVSGKLGKGGLEGSYEGFLDHSGEAISSALKIITQTAAEEGTVGVNCQYGKDRTGIITALVRYVAGDKEDDIFDDYALSEKMLAPLMPYMDEEFVKQGLLLEFTRTPRQVMVLTFDHLRKKYGSIEGYLDAIGYDESWRKKLHQVVR